MRTFIFILSLLTFIGCKEQKTEQMDIYKELQNIITDSSETKKVIGLYISDGVCSECINQELINIKERADLESNLVIIGAYPNKKLFNSCISNMNPQKKVFVDLKKDQYGFFNEHKNVFYFYYNRQDKEVSRIFYPDPCDIHRTFKYYDELEKLTKNP